MLQASTIVAPGGRQSAANSTLSTQTAISYIPSQEFNSLTFTDLHQQAPAEIFQAVDADTNSSSPQTAPLLTPAGERHLFRTWNFLKYTLKQAQLSQRTHAPEKVNHPEDDQKESVRLKKQSAQQKRKGEHFADADQMEQLWKDAQAIQSRIVQSNLRLVMKLAYHYAPTPEEVDDFISDGNLILLKAAEKFDYSRGYRFSTYATHAISRHYFRMLHRRQQQRSRERSIADENLNRLSAPEGDGFPFPEQLAGELIRRFDDCLNPREKSILEQRFGLRGESAATLKTVASSVGLSKERVRQLQRTALDKLQVLATELRLHPEACL